ncbi:SDR family NAD(P)-dependent oxidoreductase, partial [Pseudomonas fluorescens]
MKSFNGRVAAITGAASGMGRALALALAREGCHLALADKNSQGLEQTLALIRTSTLSPVTVTTQVLDVSDRQAMLDWAARCAAEHGQVNLVFN